MSLRRDGLALAVGALALRLPFVARRLWDHDSVQFALGIEHFDLAAHQPHPPGYPLYIGFCKALGWLGLPPLAAMVTLSQLTAAGGTYAAVRLAQRLARDGRADDPPGEDSSGRAAGLLAGVLYASNPLLWFYGELPLVYAVEGGMTVILAYLAARMGEGRRAFLTACAAFALAGGMRPSTLVLLFPLLVFSALRTVLRRQATWSDFALGVLTGGAAIAAWFVPLITAAGGYGIYRTVGQSHFTTLLPQTSVLYGAGLAALAHHVEVMVKWTLQGMLPALVGCSVLLSGLPLAAGWRRLRRGSVWLLMWTLPAVLFFALFHITKAGYTLVYLPGLLVAFAVLWSGLGRRGQLVAGLIATVVGGGVFLFGEDRRPDQHRAFAILRHEHNAGEIRRFEAELDRMVAVVSAYPPESSVVASMELAGTGGAGAEGFLYPWHRHLQWYLPAYPALFLVPQQGFAERSPGDRQPFERIFSEVVLAPATKDLLLVLADLPGERLRLPPAEVLWRGSRFVVLRLSLDAVMAGGKLTLGDLRLSRPRLPLDLPRPGSETPALPGEPAGPHSSGAPPAADAAAAARN